VSVLLVAFVAVTKGPVYRLRVELAELSGDFIDDRWVQATFAVVYVALAAACWPAARRLWGDRPLVLTQAAFVGLLALSTVWSFASRRTAEQVGLLALGTAAFLLAGARIAPLRLLGALWGAMQVGVVTSAVAATQEWRFAIDKNGDWAGIYFNRNSLGPVAALGVLTSVALARWWSELPEDRPRRRWVGVVVTAAVAVDLWVWWRSGSLTPAFSVLLGLLAAALVSLAATPGAHRRVRSRIAAVLAVSTGVVAVLAVAARAWFTDLLGRSTTFSGRTDIWDVVWSAVERRPVAGWGFMAVWFEPELRAGLAAVRRDVYEAHSGYLEVLVGAGVLGVVALAAVLGVVLARVADRARWRADAAGLWFVAATTFVLAANLGETYIGANLLPWMLLTAISVQASRRVWTTWVSTETPSGPLPTPSP
jgi:O-antigen ligase